MVLKQRTLKNSEACAQHSPKQCLQSGTSEGVLSYSHKKTLKASIELTLEQARFELHGSTCKGFFFNSK